MIYVYFKFYHGEYTMVECTEDQVKLIVAGIKDKGFNSYLTIGDRMINCALVREIVFSEQKIDSVADRTETTEVST